MNNGPKYFKFFIVLLFTLILVFSFTLPDKQINASPKEGVKEFVTRFYLLCLDREPHSFGLETWTNELLSGRKSGADVAYGFVFSAEFLSKNVSDEGYVKIMYRAFFDREPDIFGYNHWLGTLRSGSSRHGKGTLGFKFTKLVKWKQQNSQDYGNSSPE